MRTQNSMDNEFANLVTLIYSTKSQADRKKKNVGVEPTVDFGHPQNEPNHNIQRKRVPTAKSMMYNDTSMYYVGHSFEAVYNLKQNAENIFSLDENELVC